MTVIYVLPVGKLPLRVFIGTKAGRYTDYLPKHVMCWAGYNHGTTYWLHLISSTADDHFVDLNVERLLSDFDLPCNSHFFAVAGQLRWYIHVLELAPPITHSKRSPDYYCLVILDCWCKRLVNK